MQTWLSEVLGFSSELMMIKFFSSMNNNIKKEITLAKVIPQFSTEGINSL